MAKIIDSIVNVSISDAVSGVTTADVNTMAIFGATGTSGSSEIKTLSDDDTVKTTYGADSELYALYQSVIAQDTFPGKVTFVPIANIGELAGKIDSVDAYHIAGKVSTALTSEQATALQSKLSDCKKMLHVEFVGTLSAGVTAMSALEGTTRIALYRHGSSATGCVSVAIVAARCGLDSARGTFAHKKINGCTADVYSKSEFDSAVAAGLNVYTNVQGESRVFFGTTADKSSFVDNVVKDDWIRFNVQSAIFRLLGEGNDGYGVNYDDTGIASVASAILGIFAAASDTAHQYIMADYSVDYKGYDYIKQNKPEAIAARNLPFIVGKYKRMNSIHTVDAVKLTVTL